MDTINTSIDTHSVDKKKNTFLPKLLIALSSLFSIVGVGLAILPNHYKSARAVSYDDEDYQVILTGYEVNNYHFDNFGIKLYDLDGVGVVSAEYDTDVYLYDSGYNSDGSDYVTFYIEFLYNDVYIGFNYDDFSTPLNMFTYQGNLAYFDDDLSFILTFSSTNYVAYKSAIEQDIQANQPYEPINLLEDMITLIFGGVVGVATGVGGGLSDLVNALVIQTGAMSPFIAIVFIFGGLALAFGLSRWIVNLITSYGNRNR